MLQPVAVILVVGLNRSLIGPASPRLAGFARNGALRRLKPVLPAVTTSVQSSILTGLSPAEHGVVANGWYDRELTEIHFWKQSNHLVQGEKVWEIARRRDPAATCLNMFWWYNMHSSTDFSVTPRPIYKADGQKIPDCYSHPAVWRDQLQEKLGRFPLFHFWGPAASIRSSQWIADATIHMHQQTHPALTLAYLPHLDYALQKLGPTHPDISKHVAEIDAVVGKLLDYFESKNVRPIIVSEYGVEAVDDAIAINRMLRREGWLSVREEQGGELLDAGASEAFAVVDHQIAHVYVKHPNRLARIADVCRQTPGVDQVFNRVQQAAIGLDHPRSGDLVLVAEPNRWFSYDYWLKDARAPDFARCVEIHRKPGYDPRELFIDPKLCCPQSRIAWKLLKKKLGFRTLMDVIPLDASLVRGSHGRIDQDEKLAPVMITTTDATDQPEAIPCTAVRDVILAQMFGKCS